MLKIIREIDGALHRSVDERGLVKTVVRIPTKGLRYLYRRVLVLLGGRERHQSDFDREFGVDTDNAAAIRYLDTDSPNVIHGQLYNPADAERIRRVLNALPVPLDDYTLVDFGSGKGRVVLLASELPFQKIVGIDFSRELVTIAQANWRKFDRPTLRCRNVEWICGDFLDYEIPQSPAVLYFYHPCDETLLRQVAARIRESLKRSARPLYVLYLNPLYSHVWTEIGLRSVENGTIRGDALFANDAAIAGHPTAAT